MYDQVVQSQRAGLCLSEHFLIYILCFGMPIFDLVMSKIEYLQNLLESQEKIPAYT